MLNLVMFTFPTISLGLPYSITNAQCTITTCDQFHHELFWVHKKFGTKSWPRWKVVSASSDLRRETCPWFVYLKTHFCNIHVFHPLTDSETITLLQVGRKQAVQHYTACWAKDYILYLVSCLVCSNHDTSHSTCSHHTSVLSPWLNSLFKALHWMGLSLNSIPQKPISENFN